MFDKRKESIKVKGDVWSLDPETRKHTVFCQQAILHRNLQAGTSGQLPVSDARYYLQEDDLVCKVCQFSCLE